MQGKVKWFSSEKGYGFITPESGEDHYFNVQNVKGSSLPSNGDIVEFDTQSGKGDKGPKALNVVIKEKSTEINRSRTDDRVTCPRCGKKIVPRMITYRGSPDKSVCPYCAATVKEFMKHGCFIATAVYGDYDCFQVMQLRNFRDIYLETNVIGRIVVRAYYKISPPLADWLREQPQLAGKIRSVLDCIVKLLVKI